MRKLTEAEIERFDFTGIVPELGIPDSRSVTSAAPQKVARQLKINLTPAKKRRFQIA